MISNASLFEGTTQKLNPWNLSYIIKKVRREKITELKNKLNVSFDLENDDPSGIKKDIKLNNRTNVFKCQLFKAGGDWEYSVAYFFCQLVSGSLFNFSKNKSYINSSSGESSFFCFIPLKDNRLIFDNGKYSAYNQDHKKEDVIPEFNDNSYWKQLKEYLELISTKQKD